MLAGNTKVGQSQNKRLVETINSNTSLIVFFLIESILVITGIVFDIMSQLELAGIFAALSLLFPFLCILGLISHLSLKYISPYIFN